jgi:hypothetical protein
VVITEWIMRIDEMLLEIESDGRLREEAEVVVQAVMDQARDRREVRKGKLKIVRREGVNCER